MSEWEDRLEKEEFEPVHDALRAGIKLLEKYYRRADDTDVYFIAHGMAHTTMCPGLTSFQFSILYSS
jgi:hypothetical protein